MRSGERRDMQVGYALADPTALIAGDDGQPVIPIASDAELQSVGRMVDLHGGELVRVCAGPATVPFASRERRGCVVALGCEAVPAARLYAHLTGRRHCHVDALEHLPTDSEIAVAVMTVGRIDHTVMDRLYRVQLRHQQTAPGIVTAVCAEELALAAKRSAAALTCSRAAPGARALLYPTLNFARIERPEGIFVGGEAPRDSMVDALSSGASLLMVLFAHSLGFDISLRRDLLLCPLPMDRATGAARRPLCLDIGRCTLAVDMPAREEAWTSGRLVDFSRLRAKAMVLFGCKIVCASNQVLDPEFNMAHVLALRSDIGACITTWRFERMDPEGYSLNPLLNAISAGETVGGALHAFNLSSEALRLQLSLCLLGDPDYAIAPLNHLKPLPERQVSLESHARRAAARSEQLGVLNLLYAIANDAPARWRMRPFDRATELEQTLYRLSMLVMTGASEKATDKPWARLNELTAEFISGWPWMDNLVQPFGHAGQPEPDRVCGFCGGPARCFPFQFNIDSVPSWIVLRCSACDSFACGPSDWEALVSLKQVGSGRLTLNQPGLRGHAVVCITSATWRDYAPGSADHASLLLRWPHDDNGCLSREFLLPEQMPPGPLNCNLILASGARLANWAVWFRADAKPDTPYPQATGADAAAEDRSRGREHAMDMSCQPVVLAAPEVR